MLIVLTGFMATGKSHVGRLLAELLGYAFFDTDALIEQQHGEIATVAELFARLGEPTFRAAEHALCEKLAGERQAVIATGGGTLIDPRNLALFEAAGAHIVCLNASTQTLVERVTKEPGLLERRPLLTQGMGSDRELAGTIDSLKAKRSTGYARIFHQVTTDGQSPEDVARYIARSIKPNCHVSDYHASESWHLKQLNQELPTTAESNIFHGAIALDARPACLCPLGCALWVRWHDKLTAECHIFPGAIALDASIRWHDKLEDSTVAAPAKPLASLGGFLHWLQLKPCNVAVLTQSNIGELYGQAAFSALRDAGFTPQVIHVPDSEAEAKTLRTVQALANTLAALRFTRHDLVLALGGGVVGDVAGLLASLYMRGVDLVQVPTTLLAMIDSSIGGKNGVDLDAGKNMLGTFKTPRGIFIDCSLLATLPKRELACGMAEVIKHAIIGDPELFEVLASGPPLATFRPTPAFLKRAMTVKIKLVQADPFEQGVRAHLNLGHTFGHAIEKATNYQCPHGEAVAVGMVAAARLAESLGVLKELELPQRLAHLLEKFNLPTTLEALVQAYTNPHAQAHAHAHTLSPEIIAEAMRSDKKQNAAGLRFIVPLSIGHVDVAAEVKTQLVLDALKSCWQPKA